MPKEIINILSEIIKKMAQIVKISNDNIYKMRIIRNFKLIDKNDKLIKREKFIKNENILYIFHEI